MRTAVLVFLVLTALAGCDMTKGWGLEKKVLDALAKDSRTASYTFDVSAADDGSVTITGEIGVVEEMDVVTAIAKAVPGVKMVVNNCTYPEVNSNPIMDDTVVPGIGGGLL